MRFDKELQLKDILKLSRNEMEQVLIEKMAEHNDSQIQSDLLFELVEKYVLLNRKMNETLEEVRRLSNVDPLTGLYNRLYFSGAFERALSQYHRYKQKFAVILFDIDHFKAVNDNYGHNTGDYVLVEIAKIMQEIVRESDVCTRWGGEEFIILVAECDCESIKRLSERIRMTIESFVFNQVGTITVSLGATCLRSEDDLAAIAGRADLALYRAKNSGRNRSIYIDEDNDYVEVT